MAFSKPFLSNITETLLFSSIISLVDSGEANTLLKIVVVVLVSRPKVVIFENSVYLKIKI